MSNGSLPIMPNKNAVYVFHPNRDGRQGKEEEEQREAVRGGEIGGGEREGEKGKGERGGERKDERRPTLASSNSRGFPSTSENDDDDEDKNGNDYYRPEEGRRDGDIGSRKRCRNDDDDDDDDDVPDAVRVDKDDDHHVSPLLSF